ncbi:MULTISPECIES: GH25 family lysozyme [unclassified Mesorhizobium]|uniref:glycoside hydrolase family 25 protein n=1 Tax=unclassified Mesorhizobium TaxID=325217 RepID=UPI00112DCD31|nr:MULTISPECIES: GH25 family lysozyme [unclassified Mesorhizobium]TPI56703.1 glycoside hydrolase family 25 protein [Mesorhizobium sp. B3-1-1]TPJ88749.1 glycoside hydrolase family 25 protein [Mesorhizobium sp. B2-6-3]TPK03831.1 glycoside hydrolase family 25 protein [Mesorhizobium sp. B2-5-10]TPK14270.1 glycoside hydrolase family 25 protein [Mesorhizobium sp. B2-5-11]TPK36913.1 glycoside hydrolase family 25 protein [Mesorhizobium sp. B2-5-8]
MKNRIILWGSVSLVFAMLMVAGGFFYFHAFSPDRGKYPVRGIDVSHHQGRIDWRRVAAADVAFAVIKATEGGDHVDDAFATNLREARAAGLAVGAYHFFTFCRPGADQAKNFIAVVPHDQPLLPPVVDIEFGGNCPQRPSPEQLDTELQAFLGPVEAAFGKKAIIYLTDDAATAYAGQIAARPLWLRSLLLEPGRDDWVYWQYHNRGRVEGIVGDVDLNVLQGGQEKLSALFAPAL